MDRLVLLLLCIVCTESYGVSLNHSDDSVSGLDEIIRKYVTQIRDEFRIQFQNLENENSVLRSELESLKSEISVLKSESGAKDQGFPRHPDSDVIPDNSSLTTTDAVTEIRRIGRVAPLHEHKPQVAFQAKLDNSHLSVGNGQTIKFHNIDFNIGNSYNHLPGVFTCNEPGLYMFHLTMVLYPDKYAEFFLQKNGETFGLLYVGEKDYAGSSSTSVLVALETRDTVWVEANTSHSPGIVMQYTWSYFSGVLLYPKV